MYKQQLARLLELREGNAFSTNIKVINNNNNKIFKNVRFLESGEFGVYFDSLGYPTAMCGDLISKDTYSDVEAAREGIKKTKWFKENINKGIDPFNPTKEQALDKIMYHINKSKNRFSNYFKMKPQERQWSGFNDNQKAALIVMDFQLGIASKMLTKPNSYKNTIKQLCDKNNDLCSFADSLIKWKWYKQTPRRVEDVQDMIYAKKLRGKGLPKGEYFHFNLLIRR